MYQVVNSKWLCAATPTGEMIVFEIDRVISVRDERDGSVLTLETGSTPSIVHLRMTATQFFETAVKGDA